MKELKKILQNYSPNLAMLGEEENGSEEIFNEEINKMHIILEKLIKKETKKIIVTYIIVILIFAIIYFLYHKSVLNDMTTFFTITGLSPLSLIGTIKSYKQKINASIVATMVVNLNKESLNSVMSVFKSIIK
jgi:uncharacterized membrane protein (DUF106 family)